MTDAALTAAKQDIHRSARRDAEARHSIRAAKDGHGICVLSVPDIHCGGCVAKIERALNARDDLISARVNLTLKQVRLLLPDANSNPGPIIDALEGLGFKAGLAEVAAEPVADPAGKALLRATAVAGFGAMNIMGMSVADWAGAQGSAQSGFHLISALIGIPVVLYAGQPFFRSAWKALRVRQLNMDVPISVGVILATLLSLFELIQGGEHVFFDASTTLLFFLLCGRYLDHMMRRKARSAVDGLIRLSPQGAMVRQTDGEAVFTALEDVRPGDTILLSANEYVPVDLRITEGNTDLDRSLITGESMPVAAGPGTTLEAGVLNLTGNVEAEALRSAEDSFLAEMIRMQASAEEGRGTYVRIADRAARLYAPLVHMAAILTFIGWMVLTGGDWHRAAFIAISVLIITCPCALGLAVPVAHVVAAGRLLAEGVLMKDGSAIERMAEIDGAVFDKTGTLTTGRPRIGTVSGDAAGLAAAQALAARSTHPASRAIAADLPPQPGDTLPTLTEIEELPGRGVTALVDGRLARLGRSDWVSEIAAESANPDEPAFAFEGEKPISFPLSESLRQNAASAVAALAADGLPVSLLSGDNPARVADVATTLGIEDAHSGVTPEGKIAFLETRQQQGERLLMVGDGLNDAAALSVAHVSMAPSSASDAGRMAADFVFLRDALDAVPLAREVASRTAAVVRQNFGLAIVYNCIAIPLAVMGFVTPLIAALAMSGSSIVVIANSLRLNRAGKTRNSTSAPQSRMTVPA